MTKLSLAKWFLARSDIEAAVKLLTMYPNEDLMAYAHRFWPQYFFADAYAGVYNTAGSIEAATPDAYDVVAYSWRLQMARAFFQSHPDLHKALDFGCSRAYYSVHLANTTLVKNWLCMDIDAQSTNSARATCQAHANFPGAFGFVTGTEDDIPVGSYQAALLFEVLEHVVNPRKILAKIESLMAPNGYVVISLPSGPVEYTMWVDQPHRNREHIREYTVEDIYDVFGHKPEFFVSYVSYGPNRYMPAMLDGCFFITYRQSSEPIREINWARKLAREGVPGVVLPGN